MTEVMFQTGNPVPSSDGKDRFDNSLALDLAIMSDLDTYKDRLNRTRRTLAWMETAATGIPAVQAALDAQAARDAVLLSSGMYSTVEGGLAATAEGAFFNVLGAAPTEYASLYQKVGGVATFRKSWPTLESLNAVLALISPAGDAPFHLAVVGEEDGLIASIDDASLVVPCAAITIEDGVTSLVDEEGAVTLYHSADMTLLGPAEFARVDIPGLYVVNEFDEVLADLTNPAVPPSEVIPSPLAGDILFFDKIATSSEFTAALYPNSMLTSRDRADEVLSSINSLTLPAGATGYELPVDGAKYGPNATLSLRTRKDFATRRLMNVSLVNVPTQVAPLPINVMLIGDSIGNRQGGQLLDKYLRLMGAVPTFIGTLNGSSNPTNSGDANGPLGEAREGWETGDFTYAITDRVSQVDPGGEAAYMLLSKTGKAAINPFLRVATGSDNADNIRNGKIFDFAGYLSRFTLATPDVVAITLGTNDVRDRAEDTIYQDVYNNLKIMIGQIRAAAPLTKVILSVPGTAITETRNELWKNKYSKVIKAFRVLKADLADPLVSIAPLWAMCDHETGYAFSGTIKGDDGFSEVGFSDPVHPIGSNRETLYKSFAPFFLAAKLNLI